MGLSNYPPGVDNSHPHFHGPDWPDTCPGCEQEVYDDPICPFCGWALDEDEAGAIEDYAYDLAREMEMEGK